MESMWIYCLYFLCSFGSWKLAEFGVNYVKALNQKIAWYPYSQCPFYPKAHGIYTIQVGAVKPFQVSCDAKIAGPGWTVIARRTNGDLNFHRNWQEFKTGFGNIRRDFFIGLDKLHAITKAQAQELYVHLEDFEGNTRYAQYDEFFVEDENELYRLTKLGTYTGDAGDSLSGQNGHNFTTYDSDNDIKPESNCAMDYMGPWWHRNCTYSNLFAMYVNGTVAGMDRKAVNWAGWHGFTYSLKVIQMMVRPKCTCSI